MHESLCRRKRREDTPLAAGDCFDFQSESGARNGGWLRKKEAAEQRQARAPEKRFEGSMRRGGNELCALRGRLKTFAYLEMALFWSSVTRFGRIGIRGPLTPISPPDENLSWMSTSATSAHFGPTM